MSNTTDPLPPDYAELLDTIRAEQTAKGDDPQSPGFEDFVHLAASLRSADYADWCEQQLVRAGAPPRVERMVRLRLQDVADDGRLDLRDLLPGANPPDLVGRDSDGEVFIELKRLVFGADAQDVIRTNAWLGSVHEVMVELGELLPGGDLCYLPLGGGSMPRASLRRDVEAAASRLQAAAGGLRETPMPEGSPALLLQWAPRASDGPCRVSRQSVVLHPSSSPEALYGLVRDRVLALDGRYGPSQRERWWLVLHDEGDMVSEPLYRPEFRAYLDAADPIECRCFDRVFILGDYHPAPAVRGYPLIEVPARRR